LNASKSRSSRFRNRPLGKTSAVTPEKLAVCVKRHPFVVGSIRKECLPLKTHPKTSFRSQVSSLPVRAKTPPSPTAIELHSERRTQRYMFENRAFHSGYRSKSHRISQITEAGAKISIEVLTWTGITEQQHTHTVQGLLQFPLRFARNGALGRCQRRTEATCRSSTTSTPPPLPTTVAATSQSQSRP
jgi:hypothetical protein